MSYGTLLTGSFENEVCMVLYEKSGVASHQQLTPEVNVYLNIYVYQYDGISQLTFPFFLPLTEVKENKNKQGNVHFQELGIRRHESKYKQSQYIITVKLSSHLMHF